MGTVTERLQLLITASTKGVASEIRGVENATGAAASKTSLLQQGLSKVGLEGASTGTIMKTGLAAGVAVGGAALAKFAADGVEQVLNLTDQVRDFQRVTGASAEDSSRWVAALDDMEISSEAGARAAFKLSREVGQDRNALEAYGVTVAENKDGTLNLSETMLNVAEAYKHTSDQGERAALIQAAFGRGGKELIPILEKGREGIEKLFKGAEEGHQIFSQQDLQNAREFELALDDLQDNLRGFQIEAGKAVIPTLIQLSDTGSSTLESIDSLAAGAGGLGNALQKANNFSPLTNAMHSASAASELLQGHFSDAAGEFVRSVPVVGGIVGLFDDGADASNKYTDAQQRVKDATVNLANVQGDQSAKAKDVNAAQKELVAATRDLDGMQKQLGGSLQDVNDKLQTHSEKLFADSQASQIAAGGKLGYENAVHNVGEQFDALNQLLVTNLINQDGSAQATENVAQKHRDLAAAVLTAAGEAAKAAIVNLGPGATGQEKARAGLEAQRAAAQQLFDRFPGLREQVTGYVGDLDRIPPTKHVEVTTNIASVLGDIGVLNQAMDALNGRVVRTTVQNVVEQIGF